MKWFYIIIALFVAGCDPITLGQSWTWYNGYGDGRQVKVVPHGFTTTEFRLLRTAIHSWDVWNVSLRMYDEVAGGTEEIIHIERNSGCSQWPGIDCIEIYADAIYSSLTESNQDLLFIVVAAHELGHTISLKHVSKSSARMYYLTSSEHFPLTDGVGSDKEEFCRVYPLANICME